MIVGSWTLSVSPQAFYGYSCADWNQKKDQVWGGGMIAIWDERLSTGDAAIDAEHRQVLALLNELDVAFTVTAPSEVVQKALEALVRAIDHHFDRNRSSGGCRIGEHAALASKARRLLADWRNGSLQAINRRALMNLGRCWLDHMGRHESPSLVGDGYRFSRSSSGCHSAA